MSTRLNFRMTKESFRRDALAGTVTGLMAIPLTVGICLMSDYPVMTGIYTVIFACIVSFITSLFRPGNYVGTPGVAAGLAPALALGVSVFGVENMPFVILLTSTFQAIVWKFRLEKYILILVPHHLVEGLLAGVGIKIALKFFPFLYETSSTHESLFSGDRLALMSASLISMVAFVLLYKKYQKKTPALPYFVIMAAGVLLSFVVDFPMLGIASVPFKLKIPLPEFSTIDPFLVVKMVGFALMLGTIDVIEQVMSNVAIEKLDPEKRKCDSNNSLFAIWIANMGATLFGGMTNLDGLAKSTTNAIAGAVTKLSNLFTAAVLLSVAIYPSMLVYLPKFSLGVIMIYSGWKMIANLMQVRSHGKYEFLEAGVCAIVVYKFGIFEGLLLMLVLHSVIYQSFSRRSGELNRGLVKEFKLLFRGKTHESHEKNINAPVWDKWVEAINNHSLEDLLDLYAEDAVYAPAFSTQIRRNLGEIKSYYKDLLNKDDVFVKVLEFSTKAENSKKIDSGIIGVGWRNHGIDDTHVLRFSAVIKDGKIISHHSSILPSGDVSIALYTKYKGNESKFIL